MTEYLKWLEDQHWSEIVPGTLVVYRGKLLRAHGLYKVHGFSDEGYVLTTDEQPWLRLNAERCDLTPVEGGSERG